MSGRSARSPSITVELQRRAERPLRADRRIRSFRHARSAAGGSGPSSTRSCARPSRRGRAPRRRSASARRNNCGVDHDPDAAAFSRTCSRPRSADDRRGDVRLAQHPGERELRQGEARPPRRSASAAGPREAPRGCISRSMKPPISSLAARESRGGGVSGSYLPLSTPWPSGDQTICEMPFAAHSGMTSSSGSRHSSEYCGWLDTNLAKPRSREGRSPPGSALPAIPKSRCSESCRSRPRGSAPPSSPRAACPQS